MQNVANELGGLLNAALDDEFPQVLRVHDVLVEVAFIERIFVLFVQLHQMVLDLDHRIVVQLVRRHRLDRAVGQLPSQFADFGHFDLVWFVERDSKFGNLLEGLAVHLKSLDASWNLLGSFFKVTLQFKEW